MAKPGAVWGIDIGQSALKALALPAIMKIDPDRCRRVRLHRVSQAAEPARRRRGSELIHEALKTFLSRNSLRGDRVVISVSGQSGLARFIKLPPVEASKIPDIVKYEAKQQIPFPLEDVVWDYQQMMGTSTEEGFALEAEVGLFAMKRDQVYKVLQPFDRVDVEVDVIQLTPLALYNYVVFDQLQGSASARRVRSENPPDSLVVLSLGTDTTDLVVTNGFRVWQRSMPIGGNHFTKALTQGAEAQLCHGRASEAQRLAGRRSQGPVPGHAAGVQRPAHRSAALAGLLQEHRPQGQHQPRGGAGQRHEAARACSAICSRTWATSWPRSTAFAG